MIPRFRINGFRRLFLYNPLYKYSTTTTLAQAQVPAPRTHLLVDFLVNSIGLSKDEALTATRKVKLNESFKTDPNLVVNFFNELGLDRNQIRSIVSANPKLLFSSVHKTLQPKILALHGIGISGSDLVTVLMCFKSIFHRGLLTRSIEYLRTLLGTHENVAVVVRKFSAVIDIGSCKTIEANVQVMKSNGLSMDYISRLLLANPRCLLQNPARLVDALYTVETEFGIPRASKMFHHGVLMAASIGKEKMDLKFGVLRSFGFSDEVIYDMIRKYPNVLRASEEKMRKMWNFFTNEIRYPPDYLAYHPVIFNLSLEKRVKPRYEVLKILNGRNESKKKMSLYSVLCVPELRFVSRFVLPYEDDLPAVVSSYLETVGREKMGDL